VVKANAARDKVPELLLLRDKLEELMLIMRLAKEVKAFKSFDAYRHAVETVVLTVHINGLYYSGLGK